MEESGGDLPGIAEWSREDPNKKWWNELPDDQKRALLKSSAEARPNLEDLKSPVRSYVKYSEDLLFTAVDRISDAERSYLTQQVSRIYYVPNADHKKLLEEASVDFGFSSSDGKGLQYPDLPSIVQLSKMSEYSLYSQPLITDEMWEALKEQERMKSVDDFLASYFSKEVVPGTEMQEYETATLHPLYSLIDKTVKRRSEFKVVLGGHFLSVSFDPVSGEVNDVSLGDFAGKGKRGNTVLTAEGGIAYDPERSEQNLPDHLKESPHKSGLYTFSLKPDDRDVIAVTRNVLKEKFPVLEFPIRIDVKKGLATLFDVETIERPFGLPPSADHWRQTPIAEAFGVKFTPVSRGSINAIRDLKAQLKGDRS